jgi:flagellar basal body-associated protein FliL
MADKSEADDSRLLWISGLAIIVLLIGGMGINMLVHHDSEAQPAEVSIPAK